MSQNKNHPHSQSNKTAFYLNDDKNLRNGAISPKFGDADISSKRRKDQQETNNSKLKCSSKSINHENFSSETCLNSTLLENCLQDNLDFKGGLLYNTKEISINSACSKEKTQQTPISSPSSKTFKSAKNDLIITTKPSPTSKGFENTFKLLQKHVTCKQQRHIRTDLNSKEEQPTRLELELEAQQRLHTLLEENCESVGSVSPNATCDNISCHFVCQKPLTGFLREFTSKNTAKCDDSNFKTSSKQIAFNDDSKVDLSECEPVGLNLIYHATRSSDGTKHLRVVRNLPVSNTKVLCGNRVSQMTRAYDDIEAVTRLLEEKEKDLELTVQIGKELLTQNNTLENRISELEADLKTSNDDRAQLVHELNKKNELIAVLTNDADDGSDAETPTFSKSVTFDLLQKKVNSLQDENKSLKMEASQLAKETDDVEAHERQLMEDLTAQLNATHNQYDGLNLELERQREENRLQHEQIVSLTARLSEAEMRLHQLTHDNDEHVTLLNITKENQNSLALELVEFKQRYQEVLALLQETQEQLRKQRKRAMPQARSGSFMSSMGISGSGYGNFLQPESLQSELMESSMLSENSLDSGISSDRERANDRIGRLMSQLGGGNNDGATAASSALGGASLIGVGGNAGGVIPPYQRVFETVRCASKNGNYTDNSGMSSLSQSQIGAMSMSSSSGPRMSAMALPAGSYYRHDSIYDGANAMGAGKTYSCESLTSHPDENYPSAPAGVPGAPGAKDLEAALKRLTPAEVLARRAMLSYAPAGTYNYDEQQQQHQQQKYQQTSATLPMGLRTPDSIMSTGSSGISSTARMSASSVHQWRLPEKLQIVKPMEGSQTLHHWSRLATPTLSGLLEERPGVTIRGKRGLDDLGMQIYTLEDVEEDFNEDLPGKQFDAPGCTYTFTNSMVMHPDDGFVNDLSFLSQSQMSSRMASTSTSRQPSCPPTPRSGLSRKNSCSTFSVNLGLASMLNERGIKAVTPSALNTPAGPNFSPTVTPCNSPEGSPTRSRSPEPLFGLLSSGADLIRRKLIGGDIERPTRNQQKQQKQKVMLSRLERRALNSLRLVEKCESIGLENIIATQPSQGIVNRSSSPLSQLSSLKSLHTSSNSIVDDIHFERDQIRSVLNKGLKQTVGSNSGNKNLNKHTSAGSSAYNSDNDETLSASGSDSIFLDDEHRTPTNKPATPATVSSSSNKNAQSKHTTNSQSTTSQVATTAVSTGGGGAAAAGTTTPAANTALPLPSQTDTRIKQMQRQKSRRHLKNGMAAQRPDLGTINGGGGGSSGRVRNDLGKVDKTSTSDQRRLSKQMSTSNSLESNNNASGTSNSAAREAEAQQSYTQSFVGTVSSLLFGRKGGWL